MQVVADLKQLLSQNIKRFREARKLDQHELAEELSEHMGGDFTVHGLRGYEQAKRWPQPKELQALASCLRVTVAQLISEPETSKKLVHSTRELSLVRIFSAVSRLDQPDMRRVLEFAECLAGSRTPPADPQCIEFPAKPHKASR